jgi:hypothetical protein
MMRKLNLPDFAPRLREGNNGKQEIFDPVRKKFVRLTPEEWVRQHFLNFMIAHLGFPASLIMVEAELTYNQLKKRFDILACLADGSPCMVVECKAPQVEVTQAVFDQVAMYNMTLLVDYLVVTNGLTHYACRIDHEKRTYTFLKDIPTYDLVKQQTS